MENKILIPLVLVSILLVISIIVFVYANQSSPQSSPTNLEDCNTLEYNGKDVINLVFFSNEKEAKKYSDFLFTIPPLNENKEKFNIFYITNYQPECEIYKDIALLCYSKEILTKASSCPNDYIIVLESQPSKIRSSALMNVISINTNHPENVLVHEFGHAFANLAEEYIPAKIPEDSKNCVNSCDKFSVLDGCFKECSESSYYRSVENGIMRTLSSNNYGAFNELLIKQKIKSAGTTITIKAIDIEQNCPEEQYYLLELIFQDNQIKTISKSIEQGCVGGNGEGPFTYNLIDNQGNQISEENFNPLNIFTDAPYEETIDGEIFQSDKPFIIRLPIVDKAQELQITSQSTYSEISLNDIGGRACLI